ncbi:MAG: hypothetical protein B0A82_18155 [Alkalinema sp. CACIAM 70d]|nr:MAG: hypothetical protein B0A82_18155 [Alkalinema sp. CACIAM 70d]
MERLSEVDFYNLLEYVYEIYGFSSIHSFWQGWLAGIQRFVPYEIGYGLAITPQCAIVLAQQRCCLSQQYLTTIADYFRTHPLLIDGDHPSDVWGSLDLQDPALIGIFADPFGLKEGLILPLMQNGSVDAALNAESFKAESLNASFDLCILLFSTTLPLLDRHRFLLRLLQPHCLRAYQNLCRHSANMQEASNHNISAIALQQLGLTQRQSEVMQWIVQGKDSHEIATILGCRDTTVKKHLEQIYRKFNVQNRTAAVAHVLVELGVVESR